nr:hypothetical protein [uncultured Rhodopila sp.]
MEHHHRAGGGGESGSQDPGGAPDENALIILRRYSAGEISAREAAECLGPNATQHDVFAGIIAAALPLPQPTPDELAREMAALRAFYGPHVPGLRGKAEA